MQCFRLSDLDYVTQGKAGLVVVRAEVVAVASLGNMLIELKVCSSKSMPHVCVSKYVCVCVCELISSSWPFTTPVPSFLPSLRDTTPRCR